MAHPEPALGKRSERAFAQLHPVDPRAIPDAGHEVRAFLVVRDERLRLPSTLAHHRSLGVDRFFVVDNGSKDSSDEYLRQQLDVHLYRTDASYREANFGFDWSVALLDRFGVGHWCLLIDADEHFVFPRFETLRIRDLCRVLDDRGLEAVSAFVIDMYSQLPLRQVELQPGESLLEACSYFDSQGYEVISTPGRVPPWYASGGPRQRLFWSEVTRATRLVDEWIARLWDESGYLESNAGAAQAVREGTYVSGRAHYEAVGRFEGGSVRELPPPDWDEAEYLAAYPDVADAVMTGTLGSGFEHYLRFGYFERRGLFRDGPPALTIVPLVRWSSSFCYENGRHALAGDVLPRLADIRGAVFHFRLMADMLERAESEITRSSGERRQETFAVGCWRREQEAYCRSLVAEPHISAMCEQSARFESSVQLVRLDLMRSSPELDDLADRVTSGESDQGIAESSRGPR